MPACGSDLPKIDLRIATNLTNIPYIDSTSQDLLALLFANTHSAGSAVYTSGFPFKMRGAEMGLHETLKYFVRSSSLLLILAGLIGCGGGGGGSVSSGSSSTSPYTVSAGQTITITDPLVIQASSVNIAGNIVVATNLGQSITIQSQGDVVITGSISAGNGGLAAAGTTASPVPTASTANGGTLSISSANGSISIQGVVKAGDGLAGPNAATAAGSLFPIISNGGAGAHGGSVVLRAHNGAINVGPQANLILVGNGGNGADIEVDGQDLLTYTATMPTNGGGNGGALVLDAPIISGVTTSTMVAKADFPPQAALISKGASTTVVTSNQVSGGAGGRAGAFRFGVDLNGNSTWPTTAIAAANAALNAPPSPGRLDLPRRSGLASAFPQFSIVGADGGTGFYTGSDGSSVSAVGKNGANPSEGGQTVQVTGGNGGMGLFGSDGNGGNAVALGGNGAAGQNNPPALGGEGGGASAIGGNGYIAGNANATGGNGATGGSNCAYAQGGNGGSGGTATATVPVTTSPNARTIAQGGNGGNGGNGSAPVGIAGNFGAKGRGYSYVGTTAVATGASDGSNGQNGSVITCPAVLTSVAISGPTSVLVGQSVSLTATGNYSDGSQKNLTNFVTWQVVSPSIATLTPTQGAGVIQGLSPGTTLITITSTNFGSGSVAGLTASSLLTVTSPPTSGQSYLYLGGAEQGSVYQGMDDIIKSVGRNLEGELGVNAPIQDINTTPYQVPIGTSTSTGKAAKPARLAASSSAFVDGISAGSYHTAAIRNGQLYTWGSNYYGNLCNGTTTDSATAIAVPGMSSVLMVAAGNAKTVALRSDGTVWNCGGYAGIASLGNGSSTSSSVPVQVSGLSNVVSIATATYYGFHSLAILGDGTLWAWGPNGFGQIGDGTKTDRNVPVKVNGLTGVKAVAASMNGSLALTSDGSVWAWGQVAGGTNIATLPATSTTPTQVQGLTNVVAIAAGDYHYVALKSDGTVWAWGLDYTVGNRNGQLGNGTTSNNNTPAQVAGLSGVTNIGAGGYHSLARRNDGTVWAWGWNAHGQLGDGTTIDRYTPVQVPGLILN